ncbi:YtxH domain-containing protein [Rhodococcus pyridinivorans]|uniref:YtxH domain-containing protein n=1 Tax=Rhodococcus pyridinivorans TaxID=103816 RepID=UPI002225FFC3|nr:YtxH domain-containing protein [Rhodococcus pyridinivorans]MCW3469445.1 YtxH domain-containing protein [Rhodococcus pyridinivorans]
MMRALIFAAGAAAGFVAGTRAGRETYDKMRGRSNELWHNPAVQEKVIPAVQDKVTEAAGVVKEKAPHLQETVGGFAEKVTHRGGSGQHSAGSGSATSESTPATDEPTRPPVSPGDQPRPPE